MELGDWILVIAVVVSLGLGVTSILQTAKIQKTQYRQRWLGEIMQWATDILACWFAHGYRDIINSKVDENVFLHGMMSVQEVSILKRLHLFLERI